MYLLPREDQATEQYSSESIKAELGKSLQRAIEAYADAQAVWQEQIRGRELSRNVEPGKGLIPKYSIDNTDTEKALQILWSRADLETWGARLKRDSLDPK